MWIILNPQKAHRFTTKGINLHRSAPTAFIDPNTSGEVMMTINRAIADGKLIRVQGNKMDGMVIPKQAKISTIDTEDIETKAHTKYIRDEQGRILSTVIVMPDADGNAVEGEVEEPKGIILTGVIQSDRDEDEDDGED
jgi:hypothetical protein